MSGRAGARGDEARSRTTLRHVRLSGPDVVTVARFPVAAAIVAVCLGADEPSRPALMALFAIGVAADVVDGWWARRLGAASDRGARLDSAADAALSAAVALAIVVTADFPAPPWLWWAIAVIAAVRVAALGVTAARFRVVSIAHTWANKAAGATIAAAALVMLATAQLDGRLTAVACAVAGVAALEELALVSMMDSYHRDARGWWDRSRTADPPRPDGPAELP